MTPSPKPDSLANDLQATELFDAAVERSFIFGKSVLTTQFWDLGIIVPSQVLVGRNEVNDGETFNVHVFAPRKHEVGTYQGQVPELDPELDEDKVIINFLNNRRLDTKSHIQYCISYNDTGLAQVEKFYKGSSACFATVDTEDKSNRMELALDHAREITDDPDYLFDVILGQIESNMDDYFSRAREGEAIARSLGLAAVYHDEAEELLSLISGAS